MDLENKLKMQKMKYSKKIKEIEDNYSIEISNLNKKIYLLENSDFSSKLNINKFNINNNNNKKNYQNFNNINRNSQSIINDFNWFENVR
jgi:hypothetical protein